MKMDSQIIQVPIENIIPNRFQPRLRFSEEGLEELSESIKVHGIIQPLVLRQVGPKYEIIAGERRFKASEMAGLQTVPAIVTLMDDNESAEVAIIENTHRRNLSAIEEAKSYKKLLERKYVTQDQLAKRLGMSQSGLANKIRLLALDEAVQDALMNERISERHARSLLKVTDKMKQVEFLNRIIEERWTVKRLDEEIQELYADYKKLDNIGGINTNSSLDVNVNNYINNAQDINVEPINNNQRYSYQSKVESSDIKKNSLFFNNLENESVNMDPSDNFGFNPFKTTETDLSNEYELFDIEDDPEENKEESKKEEIKQEQIIKINYDSIQSVLKGINDIISNAKKNGIKFDIEEFDFTDIYQMIIKMEKDNK